MRLPTMLHGGPFTGGGRISQLVSLVDLPPTLLDAAGIPVPAQMQGRSILPLLRGDAVDWQKEVFMQISEAQVGRAIRSRRWKYAVQAPHRSGRDHADSDRYVESELYDLLADPEELDNRAGCASHREVAEVLRGRLIQSMLAAGESEPTIELAPAQNCINQWRVSSAEAWH